MHGAASWLEQREPADLLDEVRNFARRRPGTFLIGAAVAGLAAGRLTRGLKDQGNGQPDTGRGTVSGIPAATTVDPAGPSYPAETDPAYAAAPAYSPGAEPTDPAAPAYPAEPGYPAATTAGNGTPAYPADPVFQADPQSPAEPAYPAEPGAAPRYEGPA